MPLTFTLSILPGWLYAVHRDHDGREVDRGEMADLRDPGRTFMTPMMLLVEQLGEDHPGNDGIVLSLPS